MNAPCWRLVVGCTLAIVVGLIVSTSAPAALADVPASEHYRLVASEVENAPAAAQSSYQVSSQSSEHYHLAASGIGDVPTAMGSDSYKVNEGIVLQAEVVRPMESESYKGGGEVPWKIWLPLVVRSQG